MVRDIHRLFDEISNITSISIQLSINDAFHFICPLFNKCSKTGRDNILILSFTFISNVEKKILKILEIT